MTTKITTKAGELAILNQMVDLVNQTEAGSYLRNFLSARTTDWLRQHIADDFACDLYQDMQTAEKAAAEAYQHLNAAQEQNEVLGQQLAELQTRTDAEAVRARADYNEVVKQWACVESTARNQAETLDKIRRICQEAWWENRLLDPKEIRNPLS